MRLDNLSGRSEKRLPIAVVVRLEGLGLEGARKYEKGSEKTYTDNVSGHGARLMTARSWYPGEQAEITALNEKVALRGEVVYCQKLNEGRFFVGLKFPNGKIPWAILKRFDRI